MEIILEKKDPANATIKVNLKEADYKPKVAEKVKEYSKKVQLKGFRPGKVPTGLIEKMYGKSILVDEINQLISESLFGYIRENKLPILGDPLPETGKDDLIDWDNQKDFEFKYAVGLVPDFKYDLSDKVKFTKYQIDVEESVLNETLENLQSQYGKMDNPEVSAAGDFIYGELKEKEGSFSTNTLIPTKRIKKDQQKLFTGIKKEDTITFDIQKVFEDSASLAHATGVSKEEAEKLKGTFEFKVTNISRSEPAPMDQEFFDKIFGAEAVKSEEEFRTKLKETVAENYKREADNLLTKEIQEELIKNTPIDTPDEFLKRWLLASNQGKITEDQINKEYEFYLKELKWSIIRNKIAEDNNIEATKEEVENRTKEMVREQFGRYATGPEMEETFARIAENYLKQENGKNYMKLHDEVLYNKVLDLIKSKVKISDKKVNVEEFKKVAKMA